MTVGTFTVSHTERRARVLRSSLLLLREGDEREPQRAVPPLPPKGKADGGLSGWAHRSCRGMGEHPSEKDPRLQRPGRVL